MWIVVDILKMPRMFANSLLFWTKMPISTTQWYLSRCKLFQFLQLRFSGLTRCSHIWMVGRRLVHHEARLTCLEKNR